MSGQGQGQREGQDLKTPSSSSFASVPTRFPAGLELFYEQEKGNVRSPLDALILAVHWALVRAGLRLSVNDGFTERLPQNWSERPDSDDSTAARTVEYEYDNPSIPDTPWRYLLKIIELSRDDTVVVTMYKKLKDPSKANIPSQENTSSATTFQLNNFILLDEPRTAHTVYYNADALEVRIWNDLLEPIGLHVLNVAPVVGPYDDKTKSEKEKKEESALREPPRRSIYDDDDYGYHPARPNPNPSFDPLHVPPVGGRGIGSSDLDPLGRFGPGSILDPRGNRNRGPPLPPFLPPGAVPPGARFDPFGPTGPQRPFPGRNPPNRFGMPDPDHERPPDGFDDMFM